MQHLLGHAAEQELGDPGPAIGTDNDEIRRDLLRSRENDVRDLGFFELQQPVRLPSPSSPIRRRHDRSEPPSSDVRRFAARLFSDVSSLEGARLREARSPQSPCPGWHPIRARWPASRTWMPDAQCWFSHGACNGRASCAFDSQKELARRDWIATTTPCRLSQKRLFEAGSIDSLSVTGKMRRAYARGSRGPLRRRADPYPSMADPRAASVPRGRRLKH